jgi:GNAT superfamily N-acetyltransferase
MEFPDIPTARLFGKAEVTEWSREAILKLAPAQQAHLQVVIDALGKASATAQGLGAVITTLSKLRSASDHRLYIYCVGGLVGGMLKVGYKHLFVRNLRAELVEMTPLCVLDFFVTANWQRQGIGRKLFDRMLSDAGLAAWQLAYDRPSPKLIGFLRKHFSLARSRLQENNYVVFDDLFEQGMRLDALWSQFADRAAGATSKRLPRPAAASSAPESAAADAAASSPAVSAAAVAAETPPAAFRPAHLQSPFALFPDGAAFPSRARYWYRCHSHTTTQTHGCGDARNVDGLFYNPAPPKSYQRV